MKIKAIALAIIAIMIIAGGLAAVNAVKPDRGDKPPSGPHYTLNIIARKNIGNGDYDNPSRHTIFVPFDNEDDIGDLEDPQPGADDILITFTQGDDFGVLDGNAFDGEAVLQVPSGETKSFKVYLTSLGKPGNGADITYPDGWIEDEFGDWTYYLGTVRIRGKNKAPYWQDITEIFLIQFDFYDELIEDAEYYLWNVPEDLFAETGYFWLINGMDKHIQVRFYPE
jgi:hypothetical protein